jgi:hypothetical protein
MSGGFERGLGPRNPGGRFGRGRSEGGVALLVRRGAEPPSEWIIAERLLGLPR